MSIRTRREREHADRHQLIIDTARGLAETQGWDAVTVRRLAEHIEYSQPVLYSHFNGKVAIVSAVAEEGFVELAATLRQARTGASDPALAPALVARAYVEFAARNPSLYDAMFVMTTELKSGPGAPTALAAAFGELAALFGSFADGSDVETRTEVGWSSLHGLATLERGRRLRPDHRDQRLALLVAQWIEPRLHALE